MTEQIFSKFYAAIFLRELAFLITKNSWIILVSLLLMVSIICVNIVYCLLQEFSRVNYLP